MTPLPAATPPTACRRAAADRGGEGCRARSTALLGLAIPVNDRASKAGQLGLDAAAVGGRDEAGERVQWHRGAVDLQMVEVRVVDAKAVETPYVLRAGAIDSGQALPGRGHIHIPDAGRLGDPGLFRAEQPYPQYP